MKMTKKDYEELKEKLNSIAEAHGGWETLCARYRSLIVSNDLWMRFRWDVFRGLSWEEIGHLYSYLNDSHIDTALRRIVPNPEEME